MIQRQLLPPFRADHVGSFLRPECLKDSRERLSRGEIGPEEHAAIEDASIAALIAKQQTIGLRSITDGEFRRAFWHLDFLEQLDGVESFQTERGIAFKGGETKPKGLRVTGKLGFPEHHPFLQHFGFVKDRTSQVAKMTIPTPNMLHYRGGRKAVDPGIYPTMEEFFADLGQAYQKAVTAFSDAGCEYLQLDDTSFAYLCDEDQCTMLRERGDDPAALLGIYTSLINAAVSGRRPTTRITMHICRGNFKSMWIGQGGYEPVADALFNQMDIDGYFLEFDSERAGGFEPLRFVPKNKMVVLGLVTTKSGELESKDCLKRRIEEASRFVDCGQLCLSPQCGFASTEEGNLLSEDQQWAKLELVLEVVDAVWGSR
jgi:5-methyltetrahydropteroyltriglutamate--homocysteine methyltransferase